MDDDDYYMDENKEQFIEIRKISNFEKVVKSDYYFEFLTSVINVLVNEKEKIKRKPKPRSDDDFKEMMHISGKIGGLRRSRRQRILMLITEYFFISDYSKVSARSVMNFQKRYFKQSVDNSMLNRIYGDENRGPSSRVGEIIPDNKKLEEALKYWKIHNKKIPK